MIDDTKPSFVSVSSSLNSSAAIISWVTDENASARVEYWTGQSNSSYVNLANLSSPGSIIISPILAAATYYYNISACDEAGNCNTSGVYNFTVPGPIQKPKSGRKNHKISIKDGMKKTIISMKPSEKVIFRIDGETHTLTVGGYSDLFANITIFSEPKNYTLEVNKSLAIDVDQDNSYDLLAKYQGIFSRRLKIMFDYINYTIENDSNKEEPLPELQPIREDAVEQPAQEQPSPASVWPENRNPVFSAVSKNEGKSVFVIACTMAAVLVLIVFAGMFLSDRII